MCELTIALFAPASARAHHRFTGSATDFADAEDIQEYPVLVFVFFFVLFVFHVEKWVFGACRISLFNFYQFFGFFCLRAIGVAEKINCRRYILFAFECSQIGNFLRTYTSLHLDILWVSATMPLPSMARYSNFADFFFFFFLSHHAPQTTQCMHACRKWEHKRDDDERRSEALIIIITIIMNVCGKYFIESNEYILVTLLFFCRLEIARIPIVGFVETCWISTSVVVDGVDVGSNTGRRSKVSIFQYQHFDIFSCHILYSYMITLQRHNKRRQQHSREPKMRRKKKGPKKFLKHSGALLTCPYPPPDRR